MGTNGKQRDVYFDNAKFLLILLVVVSHAIRPFVNQSPLMMTLYLTFFTFHMPLFILISGYFSKNYQKEGQSKKTITSLLVPYLLFQVFYSVFDALPREFEDFSLSILDPYWLMWFLLSLFTWKMILPYFVPLKYPIITSVVLALLAGYMEDMDSFLSLARTAAFFPFFIAGFYLKRHHFDLLLSKGRRVWAVVGAGAIFALMYWLEYHSVVLDLDWRRWLYYSFPYAELGHTEWYAAVYRLITYVLAVAASVCFLALVPRRKLLISRLGTRSLYVYLWHGFFIHTFKALNPQQQFLSFFDHLLVILAAIGLTFFLSSNWVYRWTRPLVQPKLGALLFSRDEEDHRKENRQTS
ncbi:Fucose 4-O-acetylase [Melghirimyces thermohalophilus]|uniref:Fucose 4-O-acetylase n=1 Tax=Melghirimyces thermohalophilus TaxID=1236220 RepID=A0A1G6KSI3_9BACL|nr:acyltransferase family protein [Melghirimyces thermohalophilus]SDC34030.1 Fucose 4-O-acetylase [Melghirimyces thermohalophilus]